ncbi:glycoside hydrolase superfamily [Tribonema minus]|uniref:Glycoside hydrolase superfamily n=1 Tax=Tribonema minus TaxID=303371 RepID=A0A836CLS5_9STRA|nr:glycoside hydrolase superfamily [Tribonema minus]
MKLGVYANNSNTASWLPPFKNYISLVYFVCDVASLPLLNITAWTDRTFEVHVGITFADGLDSVISGTHDDLLKSFVENNTGMWLYPLASFNSALTDLQLFVRTYRYIVDTIRRFSRSHKFVLQYYNKRGIWDWLTWYPGVEYVDVFAITAQAKTTGAKLETMIAEAYTEAGKLDAAAPFIIVPIGTSVELDKNIFISDAWKAVAKYPRIQSVVWDSRAPYAFADTSSLYLSWCQGADLYKLPPLRYAPVKRQTMVGVREETDVEPFDSEKLWGIKLDAVMNYRSPTSIGFDWIRADGKQQQLVLELRDSLTNILAGKFDKEMKQLAFDIAAARNEVWIRPLHEFNLGTDVYPWCIYPYTRDKIELYKRTWRHIVSLFRDVGAPVKFQWCFTCKNPFDDPASVVATMYPGADIVDQVGIDVYTREGAKPLPLATRIREVYRDLVSLQKPIFIGETSCTDVGLDKAKWIADACYALATEFPHISVINWF